MGKNCSTIDLLMRQMEKIKEKPNNGKNSKD